MKSDLVLAGLLVVAVVEAGLLFRARGSSVLAVPSADGRVAAVATVDEVVTIEDLVRGCLAMRRGDLAGVPLSAADTARLDALLHTADEHRAALLAADQDVAAKEAKLDAKVAELAATLTPEQKAWIQAHRDAVSVGSVEAAYWDELLRAAP